MSDFRGLDYLLHDDLKFIIANMLVLAECLLWLLEAEELLPEGIDNRYHLNYFLQLGGCDILL